MKKITSKFCLVFILMLCFFTCSACTTPKVSVEYLGYNVGARTGDHYIDFTLKIKNPTDKSVFIGNGYFKVYINGRKSETTALLHRYEEVFFGNEEIKANKDFSFRLRTITSAEKDAYIDIEIGYNDEIVVVDRVLIQ